MIKLLLVQPVFDRQYLINVLFPTNFGNKYGQGCDHSHGDADEHEDNLTSVQLHCLSFLDGRSNVAFVGRDEVAHDARLEELENPFGEHRLQRRVPAQDEAVERGGGFPAEDLEPLPTRRARLEVGLEHPLGDVQHRHAGAEQVQTLLHRFEGGLARPAGQPLA